METQKPYSRRQATTPVRPVRGAAAAALLLLAAAAGCSNQKAASAAESKASSEAPPPAASDIPNVLANVGSDSITMSDIRARVGDNLDQLEARYRKDRYSVVNTALQDILHERVLGAEAKKQGKTVDQLVEAELGAPLEPTETDISAWYLANTGRVGNRPIDQIRPQIADFLRKERRKEATEKLDKRLNTENKVAIHLEPYRLTLNNEGAAAMGPENAKVTLVEFSDFQCPFCGRFYPTLKQIEQKYADKVRIVYRQYPIASLHPNAFKAAEASLCANDQGKFWDLHDLMFQEQAQLSVRELKEKAKRLGMDQKKFDSCLDSGRYTERVQDDLKEGARAGVTGTPALFVNGIEIPGGAVSFDVVSKALDKELAQPQR
jgi:protein-disulfide isomerase